MLVIVVLTSLTATTASGASLQLSVLASTGLSTAHTTLPDPQNPPGSDTYTDTVTASNGSFNSVTYDWRLDSGSLPSGIKLQQDGTDTATLTGIPTKAGAYSFTLKAIGRDSGYRQLDVGYRFYTITVDKIVTTITWNPTDSTVDFGTRLTDDAGTGVAASASPPAAGRVLIATVADSYGNNISTAGRLSYSPSSNAVPVVPLACTLPKCDPSTFPCATTGGELPLYITYRPNNAAIYAGDIDQECLPVNQAATEFVTGSGSAQSRFGRITFSVQLQITGNNDYVINKGQLLFGLQVHNTATVSSQRARRGYRERQVQGIRRRWLLRRLSQRHDVGHWLAPQQLRRRGHLRRG